MHSQVRDALDEETMKMFRQGQWEHPTRSQTYRSTSSRACRNRTESHAIAGLSVACVRKLATVALSAALAACSRVPVAKEVTSTYGAISEGAIRVDSAPKFVVGSSSEASIHTINLPVAATRLSNGSIVVDDYGARALLFFDSSGTERHAISGPAPTEKYENLAWAGQCTKDSIFAWDGFKNLVTVVDSSGRIVRRYRPEGRPTMMTCSRDGVFAVFGMVRAPRISMQPGMQSLSYRTPLWIADSRGDTTVPFGDVNVGEVRPLGPITRLAVGKDGLFVGTADSDLVDFYSLQGLRVSDISLRLPPRAPSRQNYESAVDERMSRLPGGTNAARNRVRKELLAIPMPAKLPRYEALFVDPTGLLWVDTSAPGDPGTELRVVTEKGQIVGEVLLHGRVSVFEVGLDYILGAIEVDHAWRIVEYRFQRAPASYKAST